MVEESDPRQRDFSSHWPCLVEHCCDLMLQRQRQEGHTFEASPSETASQIFPPKSSRASKMAR